MRTVELIPGLRSSVLGFGCAPILGAVGGGTARRALACALDCGITHFDIARSYGYGEAESFVGRFLKSRRDEVVIASKFGIRATPLAGALRPLKPVVRWLKGRKPAPQPGPPPSGPPGRDPFHERVTLTPDAMRDSLERSLRALRTDRLDYFFVHEPPGPIARLDDLADAAERLKAEGKIRGWGLAFDWQSRDSLAAAWPSFDVLQFNASPAAPHYQAAVAERREKPNVLFSPFRGSNGLPPHEVLRALPADFPNSVILCSMFQPGHIRANAAAVQDG